TATLVAPTSVQQAMVARNPATDESCCPPRGPQRKRGPSMSLECLPRRGATRKIDAGGTASSSASLPSHGGTADGSRSIFPKTLEPIRCQCRVAHRRRDRAVPEIMLDSSRVVSVVGQLVTTRVP